MVFSSPIFLFLFLPLVLTVYVLLPGTKIRNFWLLLMSLVFYAWGEVTFVLFLLASVLMNYGLGLWLERSANSSRRKLLVGVAISINIGLLAFFKYANFATSLLNSALTGVGLHPLPTLHVPLPIGISFFTFHALAYVIDIYRRHGRAANDPKDAALYIFFFPQLIAGPILRWSSIGPQLLQRPSSREQFVEGIRRFIGGLAKKVLLANTVALPADQIFSLPAAQLSAADAWLGLGCYTLQIYFDFSGYSDMAVGMGKMFGFQFTENFHFPYLSQSIKEFWRRWHISLSSWFRDYLYLPLGGNRVSQRRTYLNLLLVFFLCGLWHGASLTFVVWGLYHGAFLVLERTRLGRVQEKLPQSLRHLYTVFVVMAGWVIFRADTLAAAKDYFLALFGLRSVPQPQPYVQYLTLQTTLALILGIAFSGPLWAKLVAAWHKLAQQVPMPYRSPFRLIGCVAECGLMMALFVLSSAWVAGGTYNPFIYFRF